MLAASTYNTFLDSEAWKAPTQFLPVLHIQHGAAARQPGFHTTNPQRDSRHGNR